MELLGGQKQPQYSPACRKSKAASLAWPSVPYLSFDAVLSSPKPVAHQFVLVTDKLITCELAHMLETPQ